MAKYIDFSTYNVDQYMKLMKGLFNIGEYESAKEVARHFMHYCMEKKEEEKVRRDASPTL